MTIWHWIFTVSCIATPRRGEPVVGRDRTPARGSKTSSGPIPGTGYGLREELSQVLTTTDLAALREPVRGRWQLPRT